MEAAVAMGSELAVLVNKKHFATGAPLKSPDVLMVKHAGAVDLIQPVFTH